VTADGSGNWTYTAANGQSAIQALGAGDTLTDTFTVTSLDQLPRSRAVLLDVAPRGFLGIAGERVSERERRRLERWRHGPGAFKLDLAVRGGVPWTSDAARRAGTLHLGGTFEEIAAAEGAVARGEHPERPFVLVSQPAVADATRAVGDIVPVWTYAHVPAGSDVDVSGAILAQLERFAPGVGERIVARHAMGPAALEADDANLVGGDITGGVSDVRQLLARPRLAIDPYATSVAGVWLCSSSTPPGAGVHGLCGHHAARSALRTLLP